MPISNYPNGFLGGVVIRGIPLLQTNPGKVFWVNGGAVLPENGVSGSNGNKGTYLQPFATIGYALTQVTANRGDIIVAMPGHTETIASATSLVPVAGTAVIGLGIGNLRPTLTFSTTASQIAVAAANFMMSNIITTVSVTSVVAMFNVTAAGFVMHKVDYAQVSAKSPISFLITSAAGDDMVISQCTHVQNAAVAVTKWVDLIGADRAIIEDCYISCNATTHVIGGTTTASLDVLLQRNTLINAATNVACIIMLANSTGVARDNVCTGAKTALAGTIALANLQGSQNFATHTANKSGILDPVADA
jgi:hypothetical protein